MSFSHVIRQVVFAGGVNVEASQTIEAGAQVSVDESIAAETSNAALSFTLDVSQVKSLFILSDVDVLLETNSSSSPTNTLNLVGGVPYVWTENSYDTLKFTADVTSLFVTNLNESAARIQIQSLYDVTP